MRTPIVTIPTDTLSTFALAVDLPPPVSVRSPAVRLPTLNRTVLLELQTAVATLTFAAIRPTPAAKIYALAIPSVKETCCDTGLPSSSFDSNRYVVRLPSCSVCTDFTVTAVAAVSVLFPVRDPMSVSAVCVFCRLATAMDMLTAAPPIAALYRAALARPLPNA